jgi:hypothetical protein
VWREDQPQASVEERAAYQRDVSRWEQATAQIRRRLDEIERPVLLAGAGGQGFDKFAPHLQAMMLKRAEDRTPRQQQIAALALRQLPIDRKVLTQKLRGDAKVQWDELQAKLKAFDDLKPKPLPVRQFAVSDVGPIAPPTYIPGGESEGAVQPGFLSVLGGPSPNIKPVAEALQSTGRRRVLAEWLADENNPLATRVIVNRVWQHHFGTGLVATPDDFGRLGEPPSHPELLDWLTRRFIEDGRRFKALHRRILRAAVYRQTALRAAPERARLVDPGNRLLWRMNTRRLDAEAIRDAMLYVSGELDLRMGGPSVAASAPRRSVYVKVIRNTPDGMLGAFDMPDGLRSTAKRNVTTTPLQALMMINGPYVLARAKNMARRLERANPGDDLALVAGAYRFAYGRGPSEEEQRAATAFLRAQAALVEPAAAGQPGGLAVETMPQTGDKAARLRPGSNQQYVRAPVDPRFPEVDHTTDPERAALVDFCHVLLNSNEFLYTD